MNEECEEKIYYEDEEGVIVTNIQYINLLV